MRQHLEVVRKSLGSTRIDQWYLIAVAIRSQLKVDKQKWIDSFIKVNMHPKHRLPFDDWIKKLDQRGVLVTGEQFFEKRKSLYDAMRKFFLAEFWWTLPLSFKSPKLSLTVAFCIQNLSHSRVLEAPGARGSPRRCLLDQALL